MALSMPFFGFFLSISPRCAIGYADNTSHRTGPEGPEGQQTSSSEAEYDHKEVGDDGSGAGGGLDTTEVGQGAKGAR